ncbi:MAG TPA: hypothetical protein VFG66_17330 [Gemmatimonadales bacterium]|nr:hypothetical protein [Gemmatimonadales bacterium]
MRAPSAPALLLLPALLLSAGPAALAAQAPPPSHGHGEHTDHAVEGGGTLPEGWSARADWGAGTAEVKVVPMGKGMHVTLGPAVILYRASTRGSGPFHTLATFTQTRKTPHPEGYGLFYGGQLLEGGGETYTYFLVRGDGSYLIKRRDGEQTTDITKGWVPSPAVHKLSAKGSATNLLEIDNKRDPSKLVFMVNGQPVHTLKPAADVDGIVGIRANHHLDLHIDGFDVHR